MYSGPQNQHQRRVYINVRKYVQWSPKPARRKLIQLRRVAWKANSSYDCRRQKCPKRRLYILGPFMYKAGEMNETRTFSCYCNQNGYTLEQRSIAQKRDYVLISVALSRKTRLIVLRQQRLKSVNSLKRARHSTKSVQIYQKRSKNDDKTTNTCSTGFGVFKRCGSWKRSSMYNIVPFSIHVRRLCGWFLNATLNSENHVNHRIEAVILRLNIDHAKPKPHEFMY